MRSLLTFWWDISLSWKQTLLIFLLYATQFNLALFNLFCKSNTLSSSEGTSFSTGLNLRKLWPYLIQCFTSLTLLITIRTISNAILSNIDNILLINPSANVFVFEGVNFHYKDWLTYSSGTDRPGETCYKFSISSSLTQMVNFLSGIPDFDSHNLTLSDFFILTLVFVIQCHSLLWKILMIMFLSQFPLTLL